MKKDLINTSFVVDPESQFLSQNQGRLTKRDVKTAAVTPSPLRCQIQRTHRQGVRLSRVIFLRSTAFPRWNLRNRVSASQLRPPPYVMPHSRRLLLVCQLEESGNLTYHRLEKKNRDRRWYIEPCRAIATEKQFVTIVNEALLPQARRRPSIGHQPPRFARRPAGRRTGF